MSDTTNWENRSLEDKRESIKNNLCFQIKEALNKGHSVLYKKHKKEDLLNTKNIAYSGFSGNAYRGINSLLLDNKKLEMNYPTNTWLSAKEALGLGVNVGHKFSNLSNLPYVEVSSIQTIAVEPVYKRNNKGELIPILDENGNHKFSKNGVFMYERELKRDESGKPIPILDKITNKPKLSKDGKALYEFESNIVELEQPIIKTTKVYNIKELLRFGLDLDKLKALNNNEKIIHLKSHIKINKDSKEKENIDKEEILKRTILLDELKKDNMKSRDYGLNDYEVNAINRYYYAKNTFSDYDKRNL